MRELDNRLMKHINLLVERYPSLESVKDDIVAAYLLVEECYENGGKLLVAGNGGSAADAEHIVGELMKGFKLPRKPKADFVEKLVAENHELGSVLAENLQGALPAIALEGHHALSIAHLAHHFSGKKPSQKSKKRNWKNITYQHIFKHAHLLNNWLTKYSTSFLKTIYKIRIVHCSCLVNMLTTLV